MGGCQNYGPFLGTLNIRCHTILGTQKGTIILTTTHISEGFSKLGPHGGIWLDEEFMEQVGDPAQPRVCSRISWGP